MTRAGTDSARPCRGKRRQAIREARPRHPGLVGTKELRRSRAVRRAAGVGWGGRAGQGQRKRNEKASELLLNTNSHTAYAV